MKNKKRNRIKIKFYLPFVRKFLCISVNYSCTGRGLNHAQSHNGHIQLSTATDLLISLPINQMTENYMTCPVCKTYIIRSFFRLHF